MQLLKNQIVNYEPMDTAAFRIKTPKNCFQGDLGCLSLEISGKKIQMNATLAPVGYPILNGGTGRFPMIGLDVFQYSMPTLETRGNVSVNDKTYEINGNTWFDRQWQNINTADMTWGWMDLNLSNGVYGSLWFPVGNGKERPFVTLLYPDGTQNVVPVSPVIANARDIWKSTDAWKKRLSYKMGDRDSGM